MSKLVIPNPNPNNVIENAVVQWSGSSGLMHMKKKRVIANDLLEVISLNLESSSKADFLSRHK